MGNIWEAGWEVSDKGKLMDGTFCGNACRGRMMESDGTLMKTVAGGRDSVRNLRPRMGKTVGLMKGTGAGNPCGPRFGFREKVFLENRCLQDGKTMV